MCRKLTQNNLAIEKGEILTREQKRIAPFSLCFSEQLENNYEFDCLNERNIREFHRFIKKYIGQSITLVDKNCLREPDTSDIWGECQIHHYEVTERFRIHGYYSNKDAMFHVIRLDPRHRVHRG